MIVYHGSDYEFDELKICPEHTNSYTYLCGQGPGIYFTDRVSEAYKRGKYVYEIEIPDDVLVNCCDRKWQMEYYRSFVAWMYEKCGIRVDQALRASFAVVGSVCDIDIRVGLVHLIGDHITCQVNNFGEVIFVDVSEFVFEDEDTWVTYLNQAKKFDWMNYHTVYWFERGHDGHKGVILELSDDIRLLSRTCPVCGDHVDFVTGCKSDLRAELDAWFERACPVLSDFTVGRSEKDKLLQDAMRMIRLVSPCHWRRIVLFLENVRKGTVRGNAKREFRFVLG